MKTIKVKTLKHIDLLYSGMLSKEVFSVCQIRGINQECWTIPLNYPVNTPIMKIDTLEFKVLAVTPERLTIQLLKEE